MMVLEMLSDAIIGIFPLEMVWVFFFKLPKFLSLGNAQTVADQISTWDGAILNHAWLEIGRRF